ncbi:MAG: hypothetical protein IT307_02695 [Chloroflexi bacterium]|nr:hypothetical protein [Chloroflexota bacterium]
MHNAPSRDGRPTLLDPGDAGARGDDPTPPPGQLALVLAALLLGVLLMGLQLWLLTVALELYLSGAGRQGWLLALVSGLIFGGGLLTLRVLSRPSPVRGGMEG